MGERQQQKARDRKAPRLLIVGVRIGLNDLILGSGPGAPQYGRVFSQAASLRFYTQYAEYERAMELSSNAQSISRPVLSVAQLLRQSIRSCLSWTYFDGTELQEDDLREALAKHGMFDRRFCRPIYCGG